MIVTTRSAFRRSSCSFNMLSFCEPTMGGSPGELSEELVTWEKRKKGWRMNCDVGEATEGLENELCFH